MLEKIITEFGINIQQDAETFVLTVSAETSMDAGFPFIAVDSNWQEYELHGTPYGKTDKGMLRWFKEMCELARAKAAIEREIAWREGMERLCVQIRIA